MVETVGCAAGGWRVGILGEGGKVKVEAQWWRNDHALKQFLSTVLDRVTGCPT